MHKLDVYRDKLSHRDKQISNLIEANSELQHSKDLDDMIMKLQEVEAAWDIALKEKTDVVVATQEVKSLAIAEKAKLDQAKAKAEADLSATMNIYNHNLKQCQ